MINDIVKKSGCMLILARVNSGESRVQNEGVRAARIIRRSQDEPCIHYLRETFSNYNNKFLILLLASCLINRRNK